MSISEFSTTIFPKKKKKIKSSHIGFSFWGTFLTKRENLYIFLFILKKHNINQYEFNTEAQITKSSCATFFLIIFLDIGFDSPIYLEFFVIIGWECSRKIKNN